MPAGSVLWDIGANVGLYSCYAAKARQCRVFAFEPSVFNIELLARNSFLNGLSERIVLVPLPLTDSVTISALNMTSTEWGGALSTFGESYGFDGRPLQKSFEFSTIGVSMDDAIGLLGIAKPDFVKLDVDGIEHLILKGGAAVLRQVKSVLVEINDDFLPQAEAAARYLRAAGLMLKEKRRWSESDGTAFQSTYNQIWSRETEVPI
jgi:FkbM family methyltransferase